MKNKFVLYGLIMILAGFSYSCELGNDNVTIKMDKETFQRERNSWNSQNLKNYQFAYKYSSGSTGPMNDPVRITVNENADINDQNKNYFNDISEIYDTVSGTVDYVESVKNGTYDGHKIRSVTLDITYNTHYHYPVKVDLSTVYDKTVDGGAYYTLEIVEFISLE